MISANTAPSKTSQLRALLDTSRLDFIMEAHDGLSARIAEEAGFPALWASGLAISASLGVRDNNEASWTQILEVTEFMADATRVPILVDGDTGYGNFNNFRRVVRKLSDRGLAGVCIEDKLFPKTNSFLRGEAQPLAAVEEFSGKIKAGRDALDDPDFIIVARTEALIAGWGLKEALRRADAYREAGADAIVIHSSKSKPDEIIAFLEAWENRHPVILIPTKYYTTPVEVFEKHKVAAVIWANHLVRAATASMQQTAARIARERSVKGIEEVIAPINELFRLQGDEELQSAEARYLAQAPKRSAIILAATRGSAALHPLTKDIPKTLLRVGGVSLLDRLCDNLGASHVRDITVVAGYHKEAIARAGLRRVDNDAWESTGEVSSLALAREALAGTTIIAFGDILCRRHILQALLDDEADFVIAADRGMREDGTQERARDLIKLSAPMPHDFIEADATLGGAAFSTEFEKFDAEWIGLLKCSPRGAEILRASLDRAAAKPNFAQLALVDVMAALQAEGHRIKVHLVTGGWTSVESALDLGEASNLNVHAMLSADVFLNACFDRGFRFITGTPCSYLKPLINAAIDDARFLFRDAVNEGDAIAMGAGATLAGKRAVVMFQNSGLGNAVNALTSLCYPFKVPMLIVVTHRGEPGGEPDEPQHELMGGITTGLLDTMRIPWAKFPSDESQAQEILASAFTRMEADAGPFALVMSKDAVAPRSLKTKPTGSPIGRRAWTFEETLSRAYAERTTRTAALEIIRHARAEAEVLVATTGYTGRELYALGDDIWNFYMVGSMGSASAFGLGLALFAPTHPVTVIEGDGAVLMRMGNLATLGAYAPPTLTHIALDNEAHDSTGGQGTVSRGVSLAAVAKACGYARVISTDDPEKLAETLKQPRAAGPTFIHFRTKTGAPDKLPRPKATPAEVFTRLSKWL